MKQKTLAIAVILLGVFWASRMFGIQTFPPFIDEMAHVHFAEVSVKVSPLYYTNESRLFSIWYYALFTPWASAALIVGRTAALLMNLLSVAIAIAIARRAAGWAAGFLVAIFILFSTYHIFFGRFMLADTIANTFALLSIWFAFRHMRAFRWFDAIACGICIFLAVGSKMTMLPYLFVPFAAAVSRRNIPWTARLRWFVASLGTALVPITGFALVVSYFGYDPFSLIGMSSSRGSTDAISQMINSGIDTLSITGIYWSTPVLLLLLASLIALILRRQFFLVLVLVIPTLVIWISPMQNTRYIVTPLTLLLVCGACAVVAITHPARAHVRWAAYGAALLAFAVPGLPFGYNVLANPTALPLPLRDLREYIASDGSGFGLSETFALLQSEGAVQVVGLLSNCDALRYTAPSNIEVLCPGLRPDRSNVPEIEQRLAELQVPGVYVVVEDNDYVPEHIPGTQTAVVQRPDGGPALTIYRLAD